MNLWLLIIILITPLGIAFPLARGRSPRTVLRIVVGSMVATFVIAIAVIAVDLYSDDDSAADAAATAAIQSQPTVVQQETTTTTTNDSGAAFIGAAIAVAASALGAGIAIAYAGSAALAAVSEQPDLFGRAMVVVGLAEVVAIYGLIVAVLILGHV